MIRLKVLLVVSLIAGMAMQARAHQKSVTDTLHRLFLPGAKIGIGQLSADARHSTLEPDWLCIQASSGDVYSPVDALIEDTLAGDYHITQLKVRSGITIALVGLDSCLVPKGQKVKAGTKLGNVKLQPRDKVFTLYCLIRRERRILEDQEAENWLLGLR